MKKIMSDLENAEFFLPLSKHDIYDESDWKLEDIIVANPSKKERVHDLVSRHNGQEMVTEENACQSSNVTVLMEELHFAVMSNDLENVKKLIEQGACPLSKNKQGQNAVYLAYLEENSTIITFLKERGFIAASSPVAA